ncbi:MAG: PQQ-binding-like beta-propeller repeat protein [Candidatus Dormibacteraeota bacterium]|nr:PQQ-binding-like beta-propeller repeat protein [Candidatus Dormibacteraeota bacterium]
MKGRSALVLGLSAALSLAAPACGGGSAPIASPSAASSPSAAATPSPAISTDWTEYHGDAARTGVGPATPPFGRPQRAWDVPLDGDVYASPLVVAGHVLVATENNTVYSLDLFTGALVWKAHVGSPVAASTLPCGNITPVTGITGTPAVDVRADRLYVVAFLGGRHVLFTLRLVDGTVVTQRVVDPPGSNPAVQQERGALALGSGYVYVPFGGLYGDCGNYHGYLEAVPVGVGVGGSVLSYQVPSSREAGIWSPAGETVASSGSVYVVTGNGASRSAFDYSNSVVKLSPDLHVQSYFAPANWSSLNASDTDLGSVGATLLPSLGVVVAIGKQGVAYLLNADQLGGIGGQIALRPVCTGAWGGTAWAGSTVFVPCADGLLALSVTATTIAVKWKAAHIVLASPIVAAGVLWAIDTISAKVYALNPSSGAVLYTASLGAARHFNTLAATEGFVVAPAGTHVVAIATGG